MTKPCTNTNCGSYNPSLKNNCRHGFKDFKTFDCLGYVAEEDKKTAPCGTTWCSCYTEKMDGNCVLCVELAKSCGDYTPHKETQHSYDKILDRIEGEIPKNGK